MAGSTSAQAGGRKRPAWTALKHGQQVKGLGLIPVSFSFVGDSVDFTRDIFITRTYALSGEWQVVGCVMTDDNLIGSHASNGWRFYARNAGTDGSDTDNLSASGYSTLTGGDGGISAGAPFTVPVEGPDNSTPTNVFAGEDEVIQIVGVSEGTQPDLSSHEFVGTLYLVNSPPGRSGTP